MGNKKSIGLPSGPNEFLKDITQHISVDGYKRYSEDVNNPYNIIESGNITMEDVDFPVKGTDNLGNEQIMMPGMNYQFPGDVVYEVPLAQSGHEVKQRKGVRTNSDGTVSSHLMAREYVDGKGWVAFPTLFQNSDSTWVDMSKQMEKGFNTTYQEALKRGEVYNFGEDEEGAINFADKGSWKNQLPKQQQGSELPKQQAGGEKDKSKVLNYNNISDYIVETRGGTGKSWGDLADTIAYHESSPWSRMDPKAKQYQGGPGRGLFQFEGESFDTALKRYKNIASAKGFTLKENIINATSADQLSAEDQYTLFFANLIESKAKLSDYTNGTLSSLDVWLSGHKNVEADGDRNSFLESKAAAQKEGIKNGYKTFQEGGEIENNIMYKNYIDGVYTGSKMESKAEKIYDKLNRLHYRDAKAKQMTPANYVLTHVIG